MVDRIIRISEEVKREVSYLIQHGLKDPRIGKMVSVTSVYVTKDLRYAKVYVSVLGSEEERKQVMEGLKNARGFIRREMGKRVNLRYTPEFLFEPDNSIEHGVYINKLINDVVKKD